MTNYKDYSLQQLENWIHDALSCAEASPHEIYSVIKKVVQEEYNIHKEYSQKCLGLLELLSGHRPVNLEDKWDVYGSINFWSENKKESKKNENANKWILEIEVDGASGEYYIQLPDDLIDVLNWKEGDTLEYINNGDGSFSVKKV